MLDLAPVLACSGWQGRTFDPATLLVAARHLHQAGKQQSLAALRRWASAIGPDPLEVSRVAFLLRVLFAVDGDAPPPRLAVGTPLDPTPPSPSVAPLYPLVLVEDVPLLIVPGFVLAGFPEGAETHLDFFERAGRLRSAPLEPPDDPLDLGDALVMSPAWHRPASTRDEDRALLRAQLLRLVRGVHPVDGEDDPGFYATLRDGTAWETHCEAFRRHRAQWDGRGYRTRRSSRQP